MDWTIGTTNNLTGRADCFDFFLIVWTTVCSYGVHAIQKIKNIAEVIT